MMYIDENNLSPSRGRIVLRELDYSSSESEIDWDRLREMITSQIAWMLMNKTEALMQALYRLDVQEFKVKEVLHRQPETQWAESIATLIMEREKERLMWRQHYAGFNPGTDSDNETASDLLIR